MTTQQALLAMKLGCKIRADWMKPELYYYIQGDSVCTNGNAIPPGFILVNEFVDFFDDSYDWYIA